MFHRADHGPFELCNPPGFAQSRAEEAVQESLMEAEGEQGRI